MLTEEEHELANLLGRVMEQFSVVIGDGLSRDGDIVEVCQHVHALQNMVLSQAAARAYPDKYRLLGGTVG